MALRPAPAASEPSAASLEARLRSRTANVAVIGLGYAGLPMAIELGRAGFPILGFDVDPTRVDSINSGHSPVSNVADAEVEALRTADRLTASLDPRDLKTADVAIICVPTPLTAEGEPDLAFVDSAATTLAEHLHPDMLVALQSTCGPGTTARQLAPMLEEVSGLRAGQDFYVVFAPERIDPGNARYTVSNTPKLIGGITPESSRLACLLYSTCIEDLVEVSSPDVAEMAKLVENTFRFINISFINEMALLCDRMGVNIWEVIEAARTKPFAFLPHYPSPGVGGHCIPVVPQYLAAAQLAQGLSTELIPAANRINASMPRLVVDKLERALEMQGKVLLDANVLVVGVTYKPDVADIRESAAIRVLEEALTRGARVAYHDPLTPSLTLAGDTVDSVPLTSTELAAQDAVLLLTPHTSIDYDLVVKASTLVVDTHGGLTPRRAPHVFNIWDPLAWNHHPRAAAPSRPRTRSGATRSSV